MFGAEKVAEQNRKVAEALAQHFIEDNIEIPPEWEGEWAAKLALWKSFKNPRSRGALRFFLIRPGSPPEGEGGHAIWFVEPERGLSDLTYSCEQMHVLNLDPIFKRVEAATGDRWRTWMEFPAT
jgi:hypothetical protein